MSLTVVLVAPEGPLNVGAAARACANHGASLVVVDPRCDVTSREARMMAAGAPQALDAMRVHSTLDDALARAHTVIAFSADRKSARAEPVFAVDDAREILFRKEPVTLLFGTEKTGLDDAALARAHRVVRLPTRGFTSLNLSHAVTSALTLFTLAHESQNPTTPRGSTRARDALTDVWLTALDDTDYFSRSTREAFRPRLRAMVERMALDDDELALIGDMWARLSHARQAHPMSDRREHADG
jgi:tRNA/rRNA methyltransferase